MEKWPRNSYSSGVTERIYAVRPLAESTWTAFATLVEANGGIFGGCWCIGFHPEAADKKNRTSHRDLKHARVRAGTAHAALFFDGDDCVGWAQFGSCEEIERIKNRAAYEKVRETALPDWRIGCCFVGKGHRRHGVATAALASALEIIAGLGGGTVEGYPEPADAVPPGFLYNGAMSTYERLGFTPTRAIGKHRWVVTKRVDVKSI